jgi:hypothetical protein
MGLAGWLAGILGSATVLTLGGVVCALAGVAGAFVPAMRQAR